MRQTQRVFRASVLIAAILAGAAFLLSKSEKGGTEKPVGPMDEATRFRLYGPANLKPEFVLGKPVSEWEMGAFWLPFAGDVTLPKRIEKVKFPRADGSNAEIDVSVFYGAAGQPVRFERTQPAGWKRWWTKEDIEENMQIRTEYVNGISSEPLPIAEPWLVAVEYLRGRVNFETSVHFDLTWVDYTWGGERRSWFIINDFGDPSLCPPDSPETDKQRIRIKPGVKALQIDSTL